MKPLNNRVSVDKDSGFSSRNLALQILNQIAERSAYANLVLPTELKKQNLEPRDNAFVTELVYGSLRQRVLYDAIIERASGRKITKIDLTPLNILRLTAHQLISLDTPPHAAVDSAVRLVVRNKNGSASGFVNAVSRRISERSREEWLELLTSEKDDLDRLALTYSHPRWIVEEYFKRLGNLDEVERELTANNLNPRVTAVIYPGTDWSPSTLEGSHECEYTKNARYIEGNPEHILEIRSGAGGIQDQGSYLVAQALFRASSMRTQEPSSKAGLWLDLCAGPGGKAALLSRWAKERGRRFLALEISEHRSQLMARMTESIVVADSVNPPVPIGSSELILLDAPCTGLGALRRRPDARHSKKRSDIPELVALQRVLFESATKLLAPSGVLGYVTCSPVSEETSSNTRWFLENHPELQLIDARPFFPPGMDLAESHDVQLWPGKHQTDAMYLAIFQKSPREELG